VGGCFLARLITGYVAWENVVGLDAELIAIGPFSRKLDDLQLLDYATHYYDKVAPGAPIITRLLQCNTSDQSRYLAGCFGFDALDFSRHHVDPMAADIDRLRREFDEYEVDRFLKLRELGFQFYYVPNG